MLNFADARVSLALIGLAVVLAVTAKARAASSPTDDVNTEPRADEYRITLYPYHEITNAVTGFGYVGFIDNPDKKYTTDYLGYGLSWSLTPHTQLWGGLISTYTDSDTSANKLELRPFVGGKFLAQSESKWIFYNYTRLEYRNFQDRSTADWSSYVRARSRFGTDFPLASLDRAWQPKTWYGMADVEPFYRFDTNRMDPLRVRLGIAYIVSNRIRVEFIYHMQWTRPTSGESLQYTDNIFRLNIKVALNERILQRVFGGGVDD
jgi:hypothetical protein